MLIFTILCQNYERNIVKSLNWARNEVISTYYDMSLQTHENEVSFKK